MADRLTLDEVRGQLKATLDVLDARYAQTRPLHDPRLRWMETHPEEVARHRGKQIAVHLTQGIVAFDEDLAALSLKVDGLGFGPEDVLLASVPLL